jgi:PAS domain S-box-containing protein
LINILILIPVLVVGSYLGGKTPIPVIGMDIMAYALCLVLYTWMRRGRIRLASIGLMALGLIGITASIASLGTIRVPSAAMYVLMVITAGLLFDLNGMIVTTALCSLLVAGLIMAGNAGLLPLPDYSLTSTQWITYTAIFCWAGSLTFSALKSMHHALAQADSELAERKLADAELATHRDHLEELVKERTAELEEKTSLLKREITERKQFEELLRKEKDFAEGLINTAQAIILFLDTQGRIVMMNPYMEKFSGYRLDEVRGKDWVETFLPESDRQMIRELFSQAISGTMTKGNINAIVAKDGSEIIVEWQDKTLTDSSGNVTGLLSVGLDITERKRTEQELQQTNQDLEIAIERSNELAEQARKANAAKSEFLANMSHEIRTPLNGVIGMTGLLLDMDVNAEQREYAQIARFSGEILLSLINDILDFSKIEARKLELETLNFDLRSMLKNTADLLAIGAHEKGLELVCLVEPNVPSFLRGDPGRLRQILVNLGSNAVKFTAHGQIAIRVRLENEDERNATIRFAVSDTSIGIPANRQDILFSPFTQADGSTTRKYGGTGLGLVISKQLAELMGGKIGLESEEGEGSTFWFTAVFEKQSAGSGSADEKFAKMGGEGAMERSAAEPIISENDKREIRILVAEDNPINQKVAQVMLRKMGLRADVVANGQEAVNALKTIPYDLVLMDCQMPEMDGFEATRLIRQHESKVLNPRIPIIAMTATTMQGDREKCIQAGMSDFIAKPVLKREMAEMLARWLTTTVGYNPNTKAT